MGTRHARRERLPEHTAWLGATRTGGRVELTEHDVELARERPALALRVAGIRERHPRRSLGDRERRHDAVRFFPHLDGGADAASRSLVVEVQADDDGISGKVDVFGLHDDRAGVGLTDLTEREKQTSDGALVNVRVNLGGRGDQDACGVHQSSVGVPVCAGVLCEKSKRTRTPEGTASSCESLY